MKINNFAPFGDNSFASADANIQYIDFFGYLNNILKGNDSLSYSYNLGLGGTGIGLFSYYLSSPFNLLLLLSKSSNIYILFDIITILKLSFCGLTFSYFLQKRFNNKINKIYVIILSISYALMQYNIAQSANIMWLDGVYMLPLILLGIYKLIRDNKITLLSVSVAISIVSNWYTGGINCLFSIFWFFVEYLLFNKYIFSREYILNILKKIILYGFSMGIGVLLSSILFIPNILALRGGTGTFDFFALNAQINGNILYTAYHYVLGSKSLEVGLSIFCGSIPLIGVISYFISPSKKNEKIILCATLLLSVLFCYWQPFVFIFSMFKKVYTYWFRYSYVVIFAFIFVAANYFSNMTLKRKNKYIFISIIWSLIILLFNFFKQEFSNQIIFYTVIFVILLGVFLYNFENKKKIVLGFCLIMFSMIEIGYNAHLLMNDYRLSGVSNYSKYSKEQQRLVNNIKSYDSSFYRVSEMVQRINYDNPVELSANLNESINYDYMSIKSYTSAPSNKELTFLNNMGYKMEGERMNVITSPILGTDSLLGVKYFISPYDISFLEKIDIYGNKNNVYVNNYALDFAIPYTGKKEFEYVNTFLYQNSIYSSLYGQEVELYRKVEYRKIALSENRYKYEINLPNGNYVLYSYLPWESFSPSTIDLNGVYKRDYSKWLSNTVFYVPTTNSKAYVEIDSLNDINFTSEDFYVLDLDLLDEITSEIKTRKVDSLKLKKNEIVINITNNKEKNLLLTLPTSSGWKAYVNEKRVDITDYASCLMSIPLEDGTVNVTMKYFMPGKKAGIIGTILGFVLLILYNLFTNNKRSKKMEFIFKTYKKYEEIINYVIVGVLTTLVSLGVKWLLLFTILNAKNAFELQISVIVSWIMAVLFAYVTNRLFVFKSKNNKVFKEMFDFFGSRLITLGMEMFIMWFFITLLRLNSNTWVFIWTWVSQLLVMILNYVFSKLYVFKKDKL